MPTKSDDAVPVESINHSRPSRTPNKGAGSRISTRMTGARRPNAAERRDYTGAAYGSLLAASVVVGAGSLGGFPPLELALLLLCTGVVFWAAHVLTRLLGERIMYVPLDGGEIRRLCIGRVAHRQGGHPTGRGRRCHAPAGPRGPEGAVWLGLGVAPAGQIGWASAAALRAGATASWWSPLGR